MRAINACPQLYFGTVVVIVTEMVVSGDPLKLNVNLIAMAQAPRFVIREDARPVGAEGVPKSRRATPR